MCEVKYITPAGEEALKTFKYKGGSDSILYEFLWSPLSEFIVQKILPSWLAPNVITFSGFLLVCLASLIVQVHSYDYKTDLPIWTLLFAGFSILIYQILDNVDGKQARKTGSSSPLGMLFDHGCDTTSTWVIGLMVANCLQIGNSYLMFFGLLWMAFLGFFFAMWSQYHIGQMRLTRINAIDEGLVIIESLFFFSAIFGQGIWHTQLAIFNLHLNEFFIIISSVIAFFQCADYFRSVVVEKSFATAICSLVYFYGIVKGLPTTITSVFVITALYSPSQAVEQYAHLYIYAYGFMWSKMVGHLQLAHIVEEKFDQWKPTWIAVCSIQVVNVWTGHYFGQVCIFNEKLLVYILAAIGFVLYIHFCVSVALNIARVLNINVFTIKPALKPIPQQSKGYSNENEEIDIEFQLRVVNQ